MKLSTRGKFKSLIPVFSLLGSIPAMAGWYCECDWGHPQTGTVWTVDVNCSPFSGPDEGSEGDITCKQFTDYYSQMTVASARCANFKGPSMEYDSAILPTSEWMTLGCDKKYLP